MGQVDKDCLQGPGEKKIQATVDGALESFLTILIGIDDAGHCCIS